MSRLLSSKLVMARYFTIVDQLLLLVFEGPVGCFKLFMAGLNLLFKPAAEGPATTSTSSSGAAATVEEEE